jgi:hypothetical protein
MLGSRLVNAFFYFQNVVWLCRMLGDIIVKLFFLLLLLHTWKFYYLCDGYEEDI